MPYEACLHVIAPEDLALMDACYRPLGFQTRDASAHVTLAKAREWVATCAPLVERLGPRASGELRDRVKMVRELAEDAPVTADGFAMSIYWLFELLASEFLAKGARLHASLRYAIRNEAVYEAFHRRNLDGKMLVPLWPAVYEKDRAHTFASSPITHSPFGRFYVWRSAGEVRAFFEPRGFLFKRTEDPLKPPTPEQVIAIKKERSFYVSPTTGLEDARRAIEAARADWAAQVELLRTAARLGAAFLGVCQDTTDYE
ncbi:MAG TPA: hypothetical protein VE153_14005 [Myxococcus sp.]|nr:hypothetical protein [Myxococcus sp.]